MKLFNILAILVSLSAVFSYINHRYLRLPNTIGLMLIALLVSLGLIALEPLGIGLKEDARQLLNHIDFDETLLHGMLSFLLFAGALHINLSDLLEQKGVISLLATVGVVGSTLLIGIVSWCIFSALGITIPLIYCFLSGSAPGSCRPETSPRAAGPQRGAPRARRPPSGLRPPPRAVDRHGSAAAGGRRRS